MNMYDVQAYNFQMMTTLDNRTVKKVICNYMLYLATLFVCVYTFKRFQTQASRHSKSNVNPKIGLSLRVWLLLILSQIGYCGIIVQVVWNYNPKFYVILEVYALYSTFVALTAMINSRWEKHISAGILGFALALQRII